MRRLALVLVVCSVAALAQETAHQHAGSNDAPETPAFANRFGTVQFLTSCKPEVAAEYNGAVALLHSFEYEEAREAFTEVGKKDPACAMVKWGESMTYFHGLWGEYNAAEGTHTAAEARRLAGVQKNITAREQAYIAAISVIFSDDALKSVGKVDGTGFSEPPHASEVLYTEKMAELHRQFPDDREGTIFYALALNISAKRSDKTHADLRQCTALLTPLFTQMPNHPGVAHYIIHCNDNPETAGEGLDAARKYAQIAPASTHATHMPSHIFSQLGLWDEMVASNQVSMRIAESGVHADSCEKIGNALHAMSFLVVALSETGQLADARRIVRHATEDRLDATASDRCGEESRSLVVSAYVVDSGDWAMGDKVKLPVDESSPITGVLWMTVGIYATRQGDLPLAARAEKELGLLRDARAKQPGQSAQNSSEALRLAVAAWSRQQTGNPAEATELMRQAADLQDRLGSNLVIFKPLREMLADLLLQQGNPSAALAEYKATLVRQPNRFNSLYGAGTTSFATGDNAGGRAYYEQLLSIAKGDERSELTKARAKLAGQAIAAVQ